MLISKIMNNGKCVIEEVEDLNINDDDDDDVKKSVLIQNKIIRLEELRKDFEQDRLGLVIPELESKQIEYIQLLQEVRELQGKEARHIK